MIMVRVRNSLHFAAVLAIGAGAMLPARAADDSASEAPDFSGIWARANESWYLPVPGDAEGKPLAKLPNDNPEVEAGDYNNPILQPWAREIVKHNAELEQKEQYVPTAHGTCWPSGVPEVLNLREPVELLQEKDKITIIYQRDHQIRQIFLKPRHDANVKPSWYGESIGHYEGETLVVDTVGQAAKPLSLVDPFGTPHTDKIHVVERYRVVKDARGKGLEVVFRVEDPGAFTMPWKGMVTYRPSRAKFDEVVCAENNRTFDGSTFGEIPEQKKPEF
jgi:hypothetical protein